jgi:hypothetical protein
VSAANIYLGTGYAYQWPGIAPGYDPFTGTITQVQITTGSASPGTLSFSGTNPNQVIFIAPDAETFTVGLWVDDKNGGNAATTERITATTS